MSIGTLGSTFSTGIVLPIVGTGIVLPTVLPGALLNVALKGLALLAYASILNGRPHPCPSDALPIAPTIGFCVATIALFNVPILFFFSLV